jgi:NTP pyrophosphatase (non-canonical NTP hydrolase)
MYNSSLENGRMATATISEVVRMANEAHRRYTLRNWQEMFDEIYGQRDRVRTNEELWFRMLEECGELIRDARYRLKKEVNWDLADIFAWLCAYCNNNHILLDKAVWSRYKNGCPVCGALEDCLCPERRRQGPALESGTPKAARRKKEKDSSQPDLFPPERWTLKNWEDLLDRTYRVKNSSLDWLELAANLTEEIGIVGKTIRLRESMELIEQRVADVFAWLIGFFSAYRAQALDSEIEFADILWSKYANVCPKCRERSCRCKGPIAAVFISSVMEETRQERFVARDVISGLRLVPVMFEDFRGPFPFDQQAEALRRLREADVLVIILNKAFTRFVFSEFYEGVISDKKILLYLKERPDIDEELSTFLNEVKKRYKYERFEDEGQLKEKISHDLKELLG